MRGQGPAEGNCSETLLGPHTVAQKSPTLGLMKFLAIFETRGPHSHFANDYVAGVALSAPSGKKGATVSGAPAPLSDRCSYNSLLLAGRRQPLGHSYPQLRTSG